MAEYVKREWEYEGVTYDYDNCTLHPVKDNTGLLRFVLWSLEDAIALREFLLHNERTLETLHKRIAELESEQQIQDMLVKTVTQSRINADDELGRYKHLINKVYTMLAPHSYPVARDVCIVLEPYVTKRTE